MASAARKGTISFQRFAWQWCAVAARGASSRCRWRGRGGRQHHAQPANLSLGRGQLDDGSTRRSNSMHCRRRRTSCSRSTRPAAWARRSPRRGTTPTLSSPRSRTQIPQARFAVADFKDYPRSPFGSPPTTHGSSVQDFTDNSGTVECTADRHRATQPDRVRPQPVFGGPGAAATTPRRTTAPSTRRYHDPGLIGRSGTPRFMVVLGDSLPHDRNQNTDFPACPNRRRPTDPGP